MAWIEVIRLRLFHTLCRPLESACRAYAVYGIARGLQEGYGGYRGRRDD